MTDQPAHILVVDDYPENREVLSRNLIRQGYTVVTAEDGQSALLLVQNATPSSTQPAASISLRRVSLTT